MTKMVTCVKCGEYKQHKGHGMCRSCYNKWWHDNHPGYTTEWFHRTGKCNPHNENRMCSQYLGIFIGEKVLSKVFKNVERMPINHSGYDFICGNGYKIDVKVSCRRIRTLLISDDILAALGKKMSEDDDSFTASSVV